jgi:hypothetical protein
MMNHLVEDINLVTHSQETVTVQDAMDVQVKETVTVQDAMDVQVKEKEIAIVLNSIHLIIDLIV